MKRKLTLSYLCAAFLNHNTWFSRIIPDEMYLKILYRGYMGGGGVMDLNNPVTFNEKINWLKLHDRKTKYTQMVDKYTVKKYVADRIGIDYIIPTLGIWEKFDEIDFKNLPNQFVLKCTHDSGGLVICRDKRKFDISAAKRKINSSLRRNFYYAGREWPYKNVKPRIIAEKYMVEESGVGLTDYKFFCFDGEPTFAYVSEGLEHHETARISFLTMDWKQAPFRRLDYTPFENIPDKPVNFDKMVEISRKLSKGHSFLRVDLYEIKGKIYFSELTFFPCSGLMPIEPREYDKKLGSLLEL